MWKRDANTDFGGKRWLDAVRKYTVGLRCNPTADEVYVLKMNRSLAYLHLKCYDAALDDTSYLHLGCETSEKGLYLAAKALYGLRRFSESKQARENLLRKYPLDTNALNEMSRVDFRLAEQTSGRYNVDKLYEVSKSCLPFCDVAMFMGPVETRHSPGKGRGVYTTEAVKAGDLLLCEKAFEYCAPTDPNLLKSAQSWRSPVGVLMDLERNKMTTGTHGDLITRITQTIFRNPSLATQITDLYHGDYKSTDIVKVDDVPVVDT